MRTKQCIECKENIKSNAIKCKHCGSFQKQFKYKNEIAYSLLLLTLMISSITFYNQLNKIIEIKEKRVSKIEFDIIDTYDKNIKILARNEGNIPTVIKDGWLSNSKNGHGIGCKIPFDEPILLKENEYKVYTLYPYCGVPQSIVGMEKFSLLTLDKIPKEANCIITLNIMQEGNIKQSKQLKFECIPNKTMLDLFNEMESNKTKETNQKPEEAF